MTLVPRMSAGIRSGVNWMREKVRCPASAFALLSSVAYAQSEAPPPPEPTKQSPYVLRLDVDLSLLLLGTVLWGGSSFVGGGQAPPPWCGSSSTPPCDINSLNALDRA